MGGKATNTVDVVLDREKFDALLGTTSVKDFYADLSEKWKIGLGYKSFLNLVNNRVGWRLLHAYAIADTLGRNIEHLFKVEVVDTQERERRRQIERKSKMKSFRKQTTKVKA